MELIYKIHKNDIKVKLFLLETILPNCWIFFLYDHSNNLFNAYPGNFCLNILIKGVDLDINSAPNNFPAEVGEPIQMQWSLIYPFDSDLDAPWTPPFLVIHWGTSQPLSVWAEFCEEMELRPNFREWWYEVPSSKIRSGTTLSQEEHFNNWQAETMTFLRAEKGVFATIFHFLLTWILNILNTFAQ